MASTHIGESYKRASLDDETDVVVIGSGIGGLTTAALLAKRARMRVTVLERHYVAGGYTHTFRRPGYEWDVGLHYIGGAVGDPTSETRQIFDQITDGRLEWAPMPDVYDQIVIGNRRYDFVSGVERFRERLKGYFPSDGAAIDGYIELVRAAVRASRLYFVDKAIPPLLSRLCGRALRAHFLRYSDRTTREVLESLTDNEELIGVLTAQYLTYGLPPAESSFAMHAVIAEHYFEGGWYPVGGASRIAATIAPVIQAAGGRILVDAEVAEIAIENGRATGVRMADGRRIRSRIVVSDAGVPNTFGRLVPVDVGDRLGLCERLRRIEPSTAMVALYVGLKQSADQLRLTGTNLWIHAGYDHDATLAAYVNDPSCPLPVAYISFPSAKDPTFEHRHPGRATIDVLGFAPYRWFRQWEGTRWKRRGKDYDVFKERLAARLLEQLHRHVPQVRGKVDYWELSTPLSNRHFANHLSGEVYGISHTPGRFRERLLRPATPIRNLYLTGSDVLTEGVTGAMFGGVVAASAILKRPLMSVRPPHRAASIAASPGSKEVAAPEPLSGVTGGR